jgi:hypothetical protein
MEGSGIMTFKAGDIVRFPISLKVFRIISIGKACKASVLIHPYFPAGTPYEIYEGMLQVCELLTEDELIELKAKSL